MYRIFIADDNELVREALKSSIQWETLNCEFGGEAVNGIQALELIQKNKPDIILLDIKMPGLTGMEVIAKLHNEGFEGLFIMITAYNDFSFMRQGMQMGVFDYILKPVADKELYNVLDRAVKNLAEHKEEELITQQYKEKSEIYEEELKKASEALEEKLLVDSVNGSKDSAEKLFTLLKGKHRFHDFSLMLIVPEDDAIGESIDEFICQQSEIVKECARAFHIYIKGVWIKEGYLLLLSFQQTMFSKEYNVQTIRIAEYICKKNEAAAKQVYITISQSSSSFDKLNRLFAQLLFCKNSRFFLENKKIIHHDSLHSRSVNAEYIKMRKLENLYQACRERQTSIIECMTDFLNQLSSDEIYDIDYIKNILIQAAIMMLYIQKENIGGESSFYDTEDVVSELSEMNSLQNAFQWMMDFAEKIEKNGDIRNQLSLQTKKILDYLNEHYAEQISLQDVADYMSVSGTHVSRLLKNDIGETFITLLNKIRVKESMRLLKSGNYKVYEIAEMVGYSNYAYFYQIFKKHTGISPKDYV